ncbi:hypothetical protein VNO77_03128 [Canavalia gladiata]|uniref:Uncharacterized protein n=1 Tax=Canavalia gladiata TaxID=3824 RepID=A0AAN9MUY8_CANGL
MHAARLMSKYMITTLAIIYMSIVVASPFDDVASMALVTNVTYSWSYLNVIRRQSIVKAPGYLLLAHNGRTLNIVVDAPNLCNGLHYFEVCDKRLEPSESVAKPWRQHDRGFLACSYGPLGNSSHEVLSPKSMLNSCGSLVLGEVRLLQVAEIKKGFLSLSRAREKFV